MDVDRTGAISSLVIMDATISTPEVGYVVDRGKIALRKTGIGNTVGGWY
jgi:hypothetical protein